MGDYFGKHQGKSLRRIAGEATDYLEWIPQSDFPPDTKALVKDALGGSFPAKPVSDD